MEKGKEDMFYLVKALVAFKDTFTPVECRAEDRHIV